MVRVVIQDTLKILTDFKEDQMDQDEILMMLKHWVRKIAGNKSVTEDVAQQCLADNLEALRKVWQAAFITLELENIREAENSLPVHLKEYRYSVAGIVQIYKEVLNKSIHRKTVNDHMTNDCFGYSKLKRITVEKEYDSVLESDLLEYFYCVAHVRLEAETIRKYCYKTPIKKVI